VVVGGGGGEGYLRGNWERLGESNRGAIGRAESYVGSQAFMWCRCFTTKN